MSYIPQKAAPNGPTRTYSAVHTPQNKFGPTSTGSRRNLGPAHQRDFEGDAGANISSQATQILAAPLSYGLLQRSVRRSGVSGAGRNQTYIKRGGGSESGMSMPDAVAAPGEARNTPSAAPDSHDDKNPQQFSPRNPGMKGKILKNNPDMPPPTPLSGRAPFQPDLSPTPRQEGPRRKQAGMDPRRKGSWNLPGAGGGSDNPGGLFGG